MYRRGRARLWRTWSAPSNTSTISGRKAILREISGFAAAATVTLSTSRKPLGLGSATNDVDINGKTAVITGATRGIGGGLVDHLLVRGVVDVPQIAILVNNSGMGAANPPIDVAVGVDGVPAGYAAMDAREALKVMVSPSL